MFDFTFNLLVFINTEKVFCSTFKDKKPINFRPKAIISFDVHSSFYLFVEKNPVWVTSHVTVLRERRTFSYDPFSLGHNSS